MRSPIRLTALALLLAVNTQCCTLRSQDQAFYKQDGNFLIGGTFPVSNTPVGAPPTTFTEAPRAASCERISITSYLWMLIMVYTIEEINQEQSLLPNITLGHLIYDTCLSMERLLQGTVSMLTGNENPILNYCCHSEPPLAAIIGDSSSTRSIPMARLLGLYRQPQVSYSASSPQLSQKLQFPSFLRTVASGNTQAMGISELVLHFQWTWVGILSMDNDYGETGSNFLIKDLQRSGVCIAFHEIIPIILSQKRVTDIVEVVKKSSANVIILYATEPYRNPVINELSRHTIRGKVWIDTESWTLTLAYNSKEVAEMIDGTLGITMNERETLGFKEFLVNLNLSASTSDSFTKRLWEEAFGCKWPNLETNLTLEHIGLWHADVCSGGEDLKKLKNLYFINPDLKTSYIYKAVYVVAHGLQDLSSCVPGHGPFTNHSCADLRSFKPWQLLHYMKHVNFKTSLGEEVYFDSYGDPPAFYDFTNLQTQINGSTHFKIVGNFTTGESMNKKLYINNSAIVWNGLSTEVAVNMINNVHQKVAAETLAKLHSLAMRCSGSECYGSNFNRYSFDKYYFTLVKLKVLLTTAESVTPQAETGGRILCSIDKTYTQNVEELLLHQTLTKKLLPLPLRPADMKNIRLSW